MQHRCFGAPVCVNDTVCFKLKMVEIVGEEKELKMAGDEGCGCPRWNRAVYSRVLGQEHCGFGKNKILISRQVCSHH